MQKRGQRLRRRLQGRRGETRRLRFRDGEWGRITRACGILAGAGGRADPSRRGSWILDYMMALVNDSGVVLGGGGEGGVRAGCHWPAAPSWGASMAKGFPETRPPDRLTAAGCSELHRCVSAASTVACKTFHPPSNASSAGHDEDGEP